MIKQVVFDVGGVLLDFDPMAMTAGAGLSEDDRRLLGREIFAHSDWHRLDRGEEEESAVLDAMKERIPERLWPAAERVMEDWDRHMEPIPETGEIVLELQEMGVPTYLLSNAPRRFTRFRELIPGWKGMRGAVISCEEKRLKPDPVIFRRLFERCALVPRESFFIDDNPLNVEAAHWCGMTAFLYRGDARELRLALRRAGVGVRDEGKRAREE